MKHIVVGIGEILWDVFSQGKVLGGAPANFAFHATQLGLEGYAVSAIGKDALGQEILGVLGEKQLKTILEQVDYPTGTVQVTLNGNGIPQYEICENVAWDNIPLTDAMITLAPSVHAVCFGSLAQRSNVSRATINRFLELVPNNAYKVFDINLRQSFYNKEIIEDSLVHCNVLKINDEEVEEVAVILSLSNLDELGVCRYLMENYQLRMVVLTRGEQGSYVITEQDSLFQPTPKVEVADTVGAGDSFTGAFIAGLLRGEPVEKAHQLAAEVAAFVCTQKGAMPELPAKFRD